jgi:hypothetical protein
VLHLIPAEHLVPSQAMRVDVSTKRAAAFAKRLLQVALPGPAHFVCGALLLVSEVLKVCMCLHLLNNESVILGFWSGL